MRHGNADGLSRQTCEDCRQYNLIEKKDGGPTRQELDQDDVEDPDSNPQCRTAKIVTQTAPSDAELAKEQANGVGPVSIIYQALKEQVAVTTEQLEQGSGKLRRLHRMMGSLRIRKDGVFDGRIARQGQPI